MIGQRMLELAESVNKDDTIKVTTRGGDTFSAQADDCGWNADDDTLEIGMTLIAGDAVAVIEVGC